MNPLEQYPSVRRLLYTLQWLTTGATGVLGVVFTANDSVPRWYTITVAALAFVWSYTGLTAQSNTPKPPDPERGAIDTGTAIVIALLAGVLLLLIFGWPGRANATPVQPARPYWIDRPCPAEDSLNCFWDAEQRGDGNGHSYVFRAVPNSNGLSCIFYTEIEYAKTHDNCSR